MWDEPKLVALDLCPCCGVMSRLSELGAAIRTAKAWMMMS